MHVACDLPADKGLLNYYVSIRRGIFHLSCTLGACTTRREQRTKEISRSGGRGPRASRSAGSEFRVGDCIARVDRSIRLTTARVTRGRHFYKFFPRLVILFPPLLFKDKSMISFLSLFRSDTIVRDTILKFYPKSFSSIKMVKSK